MVSLSLISLVEDLCRIILKQFVVQRSAVKKIIHKFEAVKMVAGLRWTGCPSKVLTEN